MKFSIITPSFRNSEWLKLCIASVADQGVDHEHIVQDACSDDGTQDWLQHDKRVAAYIEKDKGMYDAINKGLQRAKGDILSYLNCDEQYTPDALKRVGQYFDDHPGVEMLFGDAIVVEADGKFRCYRKALLPNKNHTLVSGNLCVLTCAIFFRRSLIERHGLFFDVKYKALGDMDWILRALEGSINMGAMRFFTSTFTETGQNLGLSAQGLDETRLMFGRAPQWAQACRPLLIAHHRLRRWWNGAYSQKPFSYSIYTQASRENRAIFHVAQPTGRWKR